MSGAWAKRRSPVTASARIFLPSTSDSISLMFSVVSFDVPAEGGEHGLAAALECHELESCAGLALDEVERQAPGSRSAP